MTTEHSLLAVDDNPDSLAVLNQILSEAGYTVLIANSGQGALSIIQKTVPDLILLDAVMPQMDGFETCRAIKQLTPHTPVIFMTGLSDTEDVVKGLQSGGVDYLVKPLKHDELLARVQVHISTAQTAINAQQALQATGHHLAAINPLGEVMWTTDKAQQFLDAIKAQDKSQLIAWVAQANAGDQTSWQNDDQDLQLTYISRQNNGSHLLQFKTENLKLAKQTLKLKLKITRREADVLYWVVQGKTDWEISQILSISERTVNKHLQLIYRKLGVNNRTTAAALALSAL